jgi:lysophospholipase L1-like esterase
MRLRNVLLLTLAFAAGVTGQEHWVGTWATSPAPQLFLHTERYAAKLEFTNQTVREIAHVSIGGNTLRVRLSNAYGKDNVRIGAAHVALRAQGSSITAGSDRVLTFGGRSSVVIPPDAPVLSDPVKLAVPAGGDLAVSLYLPQPATGASIHYSAQQTAYIGVGDLTADESIPNAATTTSWVFLNGVEVLAPATAAAVVAFGDSITDGAASTRDANHRWPDVLAARLAPAGIGMLNAGIGGNRILNDPASAMSFGMSALARFDRDVAAQAGVQWVILMEGINDLGHATPNSLPTEQVSADDIIAGMKQIIERAHTRGLKIFGATLTPFESMRSATYFTPEKEAARKRVNEWIRTSNAFDGVVDFDQAVRDPAHPDRLLAAYDSGDHLHPSDVGYRAMGNAVDLRLFR